MVAYALTVFLDAVDPCPPGFVESHTGCEPAYGPLDALVLGACCMLGVGVVAALVAVIVTTSRRKQG